MKLRNTFFFTLLLGLLPVVLFANLKTNNSPPAISSQPTSIQLTSLTHPTDLSSSAKTNPVPISSMSDIAHASSAHGKFGKWLKGTDIKNILSKARQTGQLHYVMTKLESLRLPKSLALIPVIESHYTTGAISNKGAGGIWQLMPVTAKRFGLNKGQRYQLAASTDAALRYFNFLHQKFGNWEFAIAAYNAGEGRIQQALHKNPSAVSVQQLNLPTETKQYVLKFYMLEDYVSNNAAITV